MLQLKKLLPILGVTLLFIFHLAQTLAQNFTVPSDVDYYIWHPQSPERMQQDPQDFEYIFPAEYSSLMGPLDFYRRKLSSLYRREFQWDLDGKTSLVLTSSRNQMANGFALVHPQNTNFYFGGGAEIIDQFSSRSWAFTLYAHELAHLYQLNPHQDIGKFVNKVFGNSPFFIFPVVPLPVFPRPNFILPLWLVEGNAVMNESRFGNGGRLYNGEARALFYALLKANLLDENRLTNEHLMFPYTREKYLVGAYFQYYLYQRFGIVKTNSFFYQNSTHNMNPLRLNTSFSDQFQVSYSQLINDFLQSHRQLAQQQKESSGELLATSLFYFPLSKDYLRQKVYFLTNPTGVESYRLNILHLQNQKNSQPKLEQRPIDLLPGKIFYIDKYKAFFSASSSLYQRKELVYGLWGKSRTLLPETHSQIVSDVQGEQILYYDAKNSFNAPKLFQNNNQNRKEWGEVHSSAIFDQKGHAYYFKQEQEKRTLYRNGEKIFSYTGYYGKIVDFGPAGEVYFMANTTLGSSLFAYNPNSPHSLQRLLDSDVVVDAKRSQQNHWLVVEFSPNGYLYKLVEPRPHGHGEAKADLPAIYHYQFEQDLPQLSDQPYDELHAQQSANKAPDISKLQKYSPMEQTHFTAWNMNFIFGDYRQNIFTALFNDPLNYNQLQAGVNTHSQGKDRYFMQYLYSRYLIPLSFTTTYYSYYNQYKNYASYPKFTLGAAYPYFSSGYWKSTLKAERSYIPEQTTKRHHLSNGRKDYSTTYGGVDLVYQKTFLLNAFIPRFFAVRAEGEQGDQINNYAFSSEGRWGWGQEHYLEFENIYARKGDGDLDLGKKMRDLTNIIPFQSKNYLSNRSLWGGRFAFSYLKVLPTSFYFSSFPISQRRLIPRVLWQYFFYEGDLRARTTYTEGGVGAESELLLAHLFPLRLGVLYLKRLTHGKETQWLVTLGASF